MFYACNSHDKRGQKNPSDVMAVSVHTVYREHMYSSIHPYSYLTHRHHDIDIDIHTNTYSIEA